MLIGCDDLADELVTDDVVFGEPDEADVLDVGEDLLDHPEAGLGAGRQVDLGDVAGDYHPGAEAQPGEEHLHLLGRGVLRLVEDDERVVEGAPAHVGQRRNLDGARREQLRDRLRVEHVVQRVVERAEIGVDLLAQRAGQEAQPLPGLDRRAGQDDPVDLLGLKRLDGFGHRQVGLPGAGRADPEDDRVGVDGVDVALLVERLRADRAAAVAQDVERQHLRGALLGLGPEHHDAPLDRVGREALAGADHGDELVEEPLDQRHLAAIPVDGHLVAADVDVRVELPLDDPEELVSWAEDGDDRQTVRQHDRVARKGLLCHRATMLRRGPRAAIATLSASCAGVRRAVHPTVSQEAT